MSDIQQVYLNGQFLPEAEAKVSVFDRGFIFGDSIYEVIPAFGGHPFRLDPHLDRLDASLRAIGIKPPLERGAWKEVLTKLCAPLGQQDQSIYIQISRGVAPRDHAFPANTEPTVFAFSKVHQPVPEAERMRGASAITAEDIRWYRCDIKATSLLANVLLRQRAAEAGVNEAILIRDGWLTEGAASNVFIVKNGELRTPPKNELILPGITRDLLVELAPKAGVNCIENEIAADELVTSEEIWLTSSVKEMLPVVQLDSANVGNGSVGPVFRKMFEYYEAYKQSVRSGKAA